MAQRFQCPSCRYQCDQNQARAVYAGDLSAPTVPVGTYIPYFGDPTTGDNLISVPTHLGGWVGAQNIVSNTNVANANNLLGSLCHVCGASPGPTPGLNILGLGSVPVVGQFLTGIGINGPVPRAAAPNYRCPSCTRISCPTHCLTW
ncbi:unnamed protein product [Rotaria sp. Silwood2]|nr:unnamed protein product [Rotaria sp. Silwood2]CAF3421188.1 unnamed protein product [Rotaria sp. Silwood2]CAF4448695.1 unnamed protein product [Rotaria sp. Silwood2]CAF4537698.1 unnamed protein product [Rotaria sp. Silwood2]